MRPIDKFILHVVHNWENGLNEAYAPAVMTKLMDKFKEEADDLNIEINDEQLKKYIERFDVLRGSEKVKEKDLFKYSLSQLIKLVTAFKGAEVPETADITPDVVYHNDDDTIVVYNGSKENNCITYGRGEKWCITRGSYSTYRYSDFRSYPTFYLAQNNNLSSDDPLSFVAIQVRDPKTTSEDQRYVYTNRANSPHESQPMSFSQLEREVPWLREIPNAQQVFKYIPLSTGEKVTQQYKNAPISIREWVTFPFNTKQQYLVVRKGKTLFSDISNDDFLSKYLPKYPELAQFIAITPGIIETEALLKHLESFSNSDTRSIISNMRDKVDLSYLKSGEFPFEVKKLLTKLDKWNLDDNERTYVTKDGNAIVKLNLGDNITAGVYTAEDDYPSIKLNKRTSKYLTDYPELDKIPFKNLIKLVSDEVIDQTLLDQTLEAAKNDPDSAIVVKDTDNGQIIIDSNSFASYKIENGKVNQIPFDSEEVQAIFDEQDDNEAFQQNILKLFNSRENIPSQIDRVGLTSILNSTPYTRRIITPNYSDQPVIVLATDEENPIMFTAPAGPNSADEIFKTKLDFGTQSDWRIRNYSNRFTPEMMNAYFNYLRQVNVAFSDEGLINALNRINGNISFKKSILTNPNLPLRDENIYRPAEYRDNVYLINTQDPSNSKQISNTSGKLIKANVNAGAARRLLGAQAQQAEPEAPAADQPAVQAPAAPQDGAPRRGRPAGVPNAPREPQERQRGDINLPAQFAERDLGNGFTNLPRNDFRKLNVGDAVRVPRIGDRGATARDNQLGRAGQVTNVFSVGKSKIYFIRLNTPEPTTIASINIQPGNRNYVVIGNRAYSLNSPRELITFLQNRELAEGLRTSMFKLHLQENPHMIDEIKKIKSLSEYTSPLATAEPYKTENLVDVPKAFINKGLGKGFTDLPLEDFAKLNVAYGFASNDIGDIGKGAFARNKYLAGQGQVTDVLQVGSNRIYFIKLNNANQDQIASIKISPGNRDYIVTSQKAYSLNSPRELTTFLKDKDLLETLRTSIFKLHLQENSYIIDEIKQLNNMKNLREEKSMDAVNIHNILQTGQDRTQDFIDDNNLDGKKLADYVRQYKDSPKKLIIKDIISGKNDPKLNTVKQALIKKCKNKMTKEGLKNYIRETLKKRLAENQPAPSRETPGRETETIPDKGTEEKKRRHIGNPDKMPEKTPAKATATMNENEQEIIKQIVARFKSKK